MVPLLSVRVINNTEKTFSTFSRDPSRSLTLSQHCTRHAQWATNMSMWACFRPPFSIHWYASLSAMGKFAWAYVSNGRAISTKQAFYYLKPPGKSYASLSAMGKFAWAYVSNGRAVCSISTKQAFYYLKPPGKSSQVGVRLVRMAYLRFYNFPKIVFV